MLTRNLFFLVATLFLLYSCQPTTVIKGPKYDYEGMDAATIDIHKKVEKFLYLAQKKSDPIEIHSAARIEKLEVSEKEKKLRITFSNPFSYIPFRQDNVKKLYHSLRKTLGEEFKEYALQIFTINQPIEELIPNYYRENIIDWDLARLPLLSTSVKPIIRKPRTLVPQFGLYGRNIALWHSHGWYYNHKQDRWMWQRARLYGTVEDLLPMSYTKPYLIPMLENAGANVFVPRERDTQVNEVIIDNDTVTDLENDHYKQLSYKNTARWLKGETAGFLYGSPPYPGNYNPFNHGSYALTKSDTIETATAEWIPAIPEVGYYNVYISYNSHWQNTDDVLYTVYHSGDTTEFLVNQQIGGGTWLYLGSFKFNKGLNPANGRVTLSNKSAFAGRRITADAVKFGGGMGIVERNGQTSGRPRFTEGARYYLQTAGFPDTLVYNLNNNENDYKDDYQSRGQWVNYLSGAPVKPDKKRNTEGLGIPIDVSLAFHTDAGTTRNDTAIGTLQIYSILDGDTLAVFPDGVSRFANRDLSDIMQSQIVNDIKELFDPKWKRRPLWDRHLAESARPKVPGTLLELLSHHNFLDMKFGLDPRFRFHASRAIYKSMLRFITSQNNSHYAVQPLPVDHFTTQIDSSGNILLSWKGVHDPLEPSAKPRLYKVYIREEENGFDNGRVVADSFFIFKNPQQGVIYSFKVSALNDGGESFPSEILSVCTMQNKKPAVLIINGFDRLAAPASVDFENFSGFLYAEDNGVPDRYDYNFTGEQFNFNPNEKPKTDDRPGHGASYAYMETQVIAGNSFDFPLIHGQAIRAAGHSFISSSDEAVMNEVLNLTDYKMVDLILGEEKETGWQRAEFDSIKGTDFKVFPEKLKRQIRSFLYEGNALFLSGAYIGTDLFKDKENNYPDISFAQNSLKLTWITDHAVTIGNVFTPVNSKIKFPPAFAFNSDYNSEIYRVEAPDAIGPINGSETILRYKENGFSAGVAYEGFYKIIAFGFPFETILEKENRNKVMQSILKYFSGN